MAYLEMGEGAVDITRANMSRMKIADAANRLTGDKSLDKVTVSQICDVAQVSRQTFYQYFKDKYDIGQWYWDQLARDYLKETGRTLSWYEGNVGMIRECYRFAHLFFSGGPSDDRYFGTLVHGCGNRVDFLRETITDCYGMELTDELAFQIDFFVGSESRAIYRNALSDNPRSPEELARLIEGCVPRKLHDLIASFGGKGDARTEQLA